MCDTKPCGAERLRAGKCISIINYLVDMASVQDLDLDIGNYSIKDLEAFFHLVPGKTYDASDIDEKEFALREVLMKSGNVSRKIRRELMEFLTTAKQWLIFVKCGQSAHPSSLPNVPRLDTTTYKEPNPGTREDNLIQRKDTQYINTYSSEYFAGNLNPLATRTITKCLTIDTRFRENFYASTSSDFMIQLPTKFTKVVSMQLASIEFPVAFYGISKHYGNNFLYVELTYDVCGNIMGPETTESKTIIVPDGNYNAFDFVNLLNVSFSPKLDDGTLMYPDDMFSYLEFFLDVTATGSGTGKVTLQPRGDRESWLKNVKLDFTRDLNGVIDNIDISSKIGWNLGYINRVYDGNVSHVADTLIEPSTVRYVYLAIDDFNNSVNNHFVAAYNESVLNPNILARISLKGSYFTILMENDLHIVTEPRKYFGPVDIQKLRIRLFDEHGRILDMNNANFSFCLNFKLLYDL